MEKNRLNRRRFTRDVVVVTLVISTLVTGIMGYLISQAQRSISEQYIRDATGRAAVEFRTMTDSVEVSLMMVRDWGDSGLISLADSDKLSSLLSPVLSAESLLSGISIADTGGRCLFLQSDGSLSWPSEDSGYDPRVRPWFEPALKTEDLYWTRHYLFHTVQQVGITASTSFVHPENNESIVVAFDVLLTDLYRKIEKLAPSDNSDAFIFSEEEILMLPENSDDAPDFLPAHSISNALPGRAHAYWLQGEGADEEVFSFSMGGAIWWGGFKPLDAARENVWIGVVVPESDIVGDVGRLRVVLMGFGLVVILLVVGGTAWLSHRFRRNDGVEVPIGNTEESITDLIKGGENRYVEFKSTMRMNLHSGKPGKEIELAWLKAVSAFLNTDGGTLLLGVTDAGEITGLERDVFENEDKCRLHFKNLIANHIGAELSKHIRFLLVSVEDRTVGVVRCARSLEPVFLKDGGKEYFYIRNGPASDELPVSKALKYIKNRK